MENWTIVLIIGLALVILYILLRKPTPAPLPPAANTSISLAELIAAGGTVASLLA